MTAADYCSTLRQMLDPAAMSGASSRERFERIDALTAQLVGPAPEKIRPDVQVYAAVVHGFVTELAAVDYDFAKMTPEQMHKMQAPELTKAAGTVMESAKTDCQITPPSVPQETSPAPSDEVSLEPSTAPSEEPATGPGPAESSATRTGPVSPSATS